MEKRRVLLLDLKSYYPSPAYQLGLIVSHARLAPSVREGVEFEVREHARSETGESIAKRILETRPDLVAASDYAWSHRIVCEILEHLEASGGTLPWFVLGGPNCTGSFGRELLQRFSALSAIVDGEGEPAFREICERLVESPRANPFTKAANCIARLSDGTLVEGKLGQRVSTLDDTPSPYIDGIIPAGPSPLFYETNRGCPYRCAFCYWGNGNSRVYRMTPDRVASEMRFFAEQGVQYFWLADANFGIFKEDLQVAEQIAKLNREHGFPFKRIGVNWAKNSSRRILDIAAVLRAGRIDTTTTLALQSVTPRAEKASRRYSLSVSSFRELVSSAEQLDIDTYTDLIWGLPGETVSDFLSGLVAVASTGVPAIVVHQLFLLPGSELFDRREELGLRLVDPSEVSRQIETSEFSEYMVAEHPAMTRADREDGATLIGVNHLLHNHDLGRVVNHYLARYGISLRQIYRRFAAVLRGEVQLKDLSSQAATLVSELGQCVNRFASSIGADGVYFYRQLSEIVWFAPKPSGLGFDTRADVVEELMTAFYCGVCDELDVAQAPDERELLKEVIRYNQLIAPKPTWSPSPTYGFEWDVVGLGEFIFASLTAPEETRLVPQEAEWDQLADEVATRNRESLSDGFIQSHRRRTVVEVENPWRLTPSRTNLDWLLSSRSKHCVAHRVDMRTSVSNSHV